MKRSDCIAAAALWAATMLVFAAGCRRLGFYGDDAGWLASLPGIRSSRELWNVIATYVPGRNLHPLWQYLLYKAVPNPTANLQALHLAHSALDGVVTVAFFFVLRLLHLPAVAAIISAAWFSFWPLHGETHFWGVAAPQNLLSTLFVLLLGMTSILLARAQAAWWVWALDAVLFACALFTYEQVFFVLLLLIVLRAAARRSWPFALIQLPYVAASAWYLWFRSSTYGSLHAPSLSRMLPVLVANARAAVRMTFSEAALKLVRPLLERADAVDWLVSLVGAGAITVASMWLVLRPPLAPKAGVIHWGVLLLGVLFYLAAYLPIWLWVISPRHHYLPGIGLFAGTAVVVAWILDKLWWPAVRLLAVLAAGGLTLTWAVSGRGESRFWEESFQTKQQLFAELKQDLVGKEVLVLEDFPQFWGPAYFIMHHDAAFAPRFVYSGSIELDPRFTGSISSAPAPRGIFLQTLYRGGSEDFRYRPSDSFLVVQFERWEDGRLKYRKYSARKLPYEVLSSYAGPSPGPPEPPEVAARRSGDALVVSLKFHAPVSAQAYLAAVVGFAQGPNFHPWGRAGHEYVFHIQPVLLSGPDPRFHSGGYELKQTLKLASFPETNRIQVKFLEAWPARDPVLLARAEAPVQQ